MQHVSLVPRLRPGNHECKAPPRCLGYASRMTTLFKLSFTLLLLSLSACHPPDPVRGGVVGPKNLFDGKLLDLTHPFNADTIFWPTEKGFDFQPGNNGVTEKGYYYAANRFCTAEHGGTHIDAPIHFFAQRHTVDEIELDRLVGEAAVIDVSEKCSTDRDYLISLADLRAWEQQHGRQLIDLIVLLRTGYSRHWPDHEKYLGTPDRGSEAVAKLRFPGLAPDAARWLAEHRAPKAVGIDTASIDYGQSSHFESHIALLEKNIPVFENVAHLDQLPAAGAHIIALPMKISGGSGGPLRIIALLPQ